MNRKKSLQFTLFSMIIFMIIHIIHLWATLKLLQYFHEISGNMPLPKRPKIVFLTNCANNIEHFFWLFFPIIKCIFTPKFPKVNFSSSSAYNIGHFYDFFLWESIKSVKISNISVKILYMAGICMSGRLCDALWISRFHFVKVIFIQIFLW